MQTVYLPLHESVPIALSSELEKRIFFISNDIVDFKLIETHSLIQGIEVTHTLDDKWQQLSEKINDVVLKEILRQKYIPSKIIWSSEKNDTNYPNIFQTLVDKGIAFESGEGQVGFGEPLIMLMDYLDRRLKHIALQSLGAYEYRYPTLLPTKVLEALDYFTSFPQFAMFVTRLHNDLDIYRAFLNEYEDEKRITPSVFSYCQNHDYCLPPTMCYHTYHQFRDQELNNNLVVTAKGKSFRFESKYYQGLERLWDFTIREVVFLGTREYVLDCRQTFINAAISLMQELDLHGFCEVANDPFFAGQETVSKIFAQKAMELKYELRLKTDADRSIAVGSFNFHDTFFGQGFNITQHDGPVMTGCVGFGLERFVYAFLCQHGLDKRGWPETLNSVDAHAT